MDWITGIQKAIDYMEDNLLLDLNINEIAKKAYVSGFYFQRIFNVICGYTVAEYIRNRRLTLAVMELQTKNIVVLEGGSIMDYKIVERPAFKIIYKGERVKVADGANIREIPKFWDRCLCDDTVTKLLDFSRKANEDDDLYNTTFGMADPETFEDSSYIYKIGSIYIGGDVPEGFFTQDIPAHTWIKFTSVLLNDNYLDVFKKIFSEFFPTSDYIPLGQFEVFPESDRSHKDYLCEIWIPAKKKS